MQFKKKNVCWKKINNELRNAKLYRPRRKLCHHCRLNRTGAAPRLPDVHPLVIPPGGQHLCHCRLSPYFGSDSYQDLPGLCVVSGLGGDPHQPWKSKWSYSLPEEVNPWKITGKEASIDEFCSPASGYYSSAPPKDKNNVIETIINHPQITINKFYKPFLIVLVYYCFNHINEYNL